MNPLLYLDDQLLALDDTLLDRKTSTQLPSQDANTAYTNHPWHKSYQFNPHLSREESITAILVKALTVFPSPDFSLCLHLLPPSTLIANGPDASSLADSVQKLNGLNNQLSSADYTAFWNTLRSDDIYADLVSEVNGFEELMRVRIAAMVSQSVREIERPILEEWLDLTGEQFDQFVSEGCGFEVEGEMVKVPLNKENEAKGTVVTENVKFDRKFCAKCWKNWMNSC